jgi:hypothetical protein
LSKNASSNKIAEKLDAGLNDITQNDISIIENDGAVDDSQTMEISDIFKKHKG